jgi:hypothetical protein
MNIKPVFAILLVTYLKAACLDAYTQSYSREYRSIRKNLRSGTSVKESSSVTFLARRAGLYMLFPRNNLCSLIINVYYTHVQLSNGWYFIRRMI